MTDTGSLDRTVSIVEDLAVGELSPGQHLPAEAELAAVCSVSRATVREALKVLAGRGVIELAKGRRALVRGTDPSLVAAHLAVAIRRDPKSASELAEVRRALQEQAASLAAARASRAAMFAVQSAYAAMSEQLSEPLPGSVQETCAAFDRADRAFLGALALASGNGMLDLLLDSLTDALDPQAPAAADLDATGTEDPAPALESRRRLLGTRRALVDAVRDRDTERAARAMAAAHRLGVRKR